MKKERRRRDLNAQRLAPAGFPGLCHTRLGDSGICIFYK